MSHIDALLAHYCSIMGDRYSEVTKGPDEYGIRVFAFDTAAHGPVPCTLVTLGMSAHPMATPPEAYQRARAELVWYVTEPAQRYVSWLAWLAAFPFDDSTWVGHGHTVQWREPLFPGSRLQHFFLLPPLVRQHRAVYSHVTVDGVGVSMWWVVPITGPELALKIGEGVDALIDLLGKHNCPLVLDEGRASFA